MNEVDLPAGCMLVAGITVHVAVARRFTSDFRRFQRVLPLLDKVERWRPGSREWRACVDDLLSEHRDITVDDLARTIRETAAIAQALAPDPDVESVTDRRSERHARRDRPDSGAME